MPAPFTQLAVEYRTGTAVLHCYSFSQTHFFPLFSAKQLYFRWKLL